MNIYKILILLAISCMGCLYGQNEHNSKRAQMYTTLVDKSQGDSKCNSDTLSTTFIFKVISSTDTLVTPGSILAIAIICPRNFEGEFIVGKSYNLKLSNEPSYNGSLITDLLIDGGNLIREYNKSERIYWVTDMNEMNPYFIRMAEVKLGLADFPMKELNSEKPLSSMYEVNSDDNKREIKSGSLIYSSNYSFPINNESYLVDGEVGVYVDTTSLGYYDNEYEGYNMYLYNNSGDTAFFPSVDSRILLIAQAQDQSGVWRDIESISSSNCSFSYYDVILINGNQWSFVAPLPNGKNPTKIRMSLYYSIDSSRKIAYSNEYLGSINWGQLIIKE